MRLTPARRTPTRPTAHHGGFLRTYVFSLDHKIIGIQFLFSTLLWFVVGGLLALGVRWQLAWPWSDMPIVGQMLFSAEGGQISPEFYTMLFTMHATVMIFFVIIPILAGAFGNFLIPLMIGADDMAFPTLNMLSYWFMWPAFICMICSFFVARRCRGGRLDRLSAAVGPSQSAAPGSHDGQTLWLMGLTFVGVSSMMGSVNYMTTIIQMRAPGMTMFRLPMTIWAMFITAMLQAFALPVLTAAGFMQLLDRMLGTGFFIPEGLIVNNVVAGGRRRTAAVVAALVLVLLAPGRVHHDPAGDGHGLRHHHLLRPQAAVRLQADGLFDLRHRRTGLHRLGTPHVHVGHEPAAGHDVHGLDDDDRAAQRRSRSSTGSARSGAARFSSPRRCCSRCRSCRCSSSAGCRASSWRPRRSTSTSTTPTSSSPTSTTCCSPARRSACSAASTSGSPRCSAG